MAIFVVTQDPWSAKQEELKKQSSSNTRALQRNTVRRPTRGIVINDDTFATLRVVTTHGANIALVDAGSRAGDSQPLEINGMRANDIYSNFLLQSVSEERVEKAQILETFGDPYIFLFGERARVMNFSGILANTFDFNWEAEWWFNYDNYIRGTRCVENGARVFLSFDNTLVSGYIIASSAQKSAQERNFITFNFQLFVTSYTTLTALGDPRANAGFDPTSVTDVSLNEFRPQLIDSNTQNGTAIQDMAFLDGTLDPNQSPLLTAIEDGAQTAIDAAASLFNSIEIYGNTYARLINNVLNGTVVRIPIGFAGSMVFDNNDKIITVNEFNVDSRAVTFTVFSDNEDEYVGRSDHYGTPLDINNNGLTLRQFNFEDDINGKYNQGTLQVLQAQDIWEEAGQTVPLESFFTQAAAVASPLKKLGVLIYSAVQTARGLTNILTTTTKASTPSPAFASPVSGATKTGSGTLTHSPVPTQVP